VVEAEEQAFVQKLVTHSAIEGFDVAGCSTRALWHNRNGPGSKRGWMTVQWQVSTGSLGPKSSWVPSAPSVV
jgi:hypothetical protein